MQQIESHATEKFSKESRTHRNGNRSTDDSHFSTGASLRTWRCHGRRFAWQRRLAMSLAARHRVASPRESWSCVRRKQGRTTLTGRKALPIDANGENCRGHVCHSKRRVFLVSLADWHVIELQCGGEAAVVMTR